MSVAQLRSTTSRPFSSRSATERQPNLKFLLHPKQGVAFYSTETEMILCGSADRECWARYRALIWKPTTTIKKKRRCGLHGGAHGWQSHPDGLASSRPCRAINHSAEA